jgi:hypothetical protein
VAVASIVSGALAVLLYLSGTRRVRFANDDVVRSVLNGHIDWPVLVEAEERVKAERAKAEAGSRRAV